MFEKLKELFTDEEETPTLEVKKELTQVEIPAPKPEEVVIGDEDKEITKEIPKIESFQNSNPVFFDDDDFIDLKKKEENKIDSFKNTYHPKPKVEEKKFKPSKIISPVYGVLGENYDTDDIHVRNEYIPPKNTYIAKSKIPTLDEVREKAFGTLDEDLEATLVRKKYLLEKDDEKDIKHAVRDLDYASDMTFEELDRITKNNTKKLEGNELFDLIDSMHERNEDE